VNSLFFVCVFWFWFIIISGFFNTLLFLLFDMICLFYCLFVLIVLFGCDPLVSYGKFYKSFGGGYGFVF